MWQTSHRCADFLFVYRSSLIYKFIVSDTFDDMISKNNWWEQEAFKTYSWAFSDIWVLCHCTMFFLYCESVSKIWGLILDDRHVIKGQFFKVWYSEKLNKFKGRCKLRQLLSIVHSSKGIWHSSVNFFFFEKENFIKTEKELDKHNGLHQ